MPLDGRRIINDVGVNGVTQALASSDVVVDPLFWTQKTGPDRYLLRWTASPSYLSDSTGRNRGAQQNTAPGAGNRGDVQAILLPRL